MVGNKFKCGERAHYAAFLYIILFSGSSSYLCYIEAPFCGSVEFTMAQYLDEGESVGTSKYRQGDRVLEASVHINSFEMASADDVGCLAARRPTKTTQYSKNERSQENEGMAREPRMPYCPFTFRSRRRRLGSFFLS